jgi:membrane protease YdiL (CAAX protease family)
MLERLYQGKLMSALKDFSLILLSILFVPCGAMLFMAQYVLFFWSYGPLGYIYAMWHVIAFLIFALSIDYKRSKGMENWHFESRTVTTKQIDEYVEFMNKTKEKKQK